jgi:PAS domain S-box-containing protein
MGARDEAEGGRFDLLAGVGRVADGSLAFQTTVERLLELVVPAFADLALLDAVGGEGGLRRLGVRVEAPNRRELEAALLRRRIVNDAPVGIAHAVRTKQSNLLSPVTEQDLRLIASSEEDFELLRSLELSSTLFVPLRARGRTLGAFACAVGLSGRRYEADDLRFAEVLAGRISLALDNAGLSRMVGELERQLESIFANLAEAVLVRDPGGQMVFANQAAAGLLGFDSVEEMTAASAQEMMARFKAFDEAGRELSLADLPSAQAAAGHPADPLLVRNLVRDTGAERWLLHKSTPVFDPDGQLSLVVNVIEDVTETKRAEIAQRFLAEAGRELSSSLDYEQTI